MNKFKKVTVLIVLSLMLASIGTSYAQQTGGSSGSRGGGDIILFDLVNTAVHAEQGGTGSTYTVWRGSDPYDSTPSDMTNMGGTSEGKARFERYKPHN